MQGGLGRWGASDGGGDGGSGVADAAGTAAAAGAACAIGGGATGGAPVAAVAAALPPPPKCGANMAKTCGAPVCCHTRRPPRSPARHFAPSRATCTTISAVGCPLEAS